MSYIGNIYGNIKVLDATTQNKPCKAKCLLCGKIWSPRLDSIVHGKVVSCGCAKSKPKECLEGKTFNGINVLEHQGSLQATVKCRCHCKRIFFARAASIKYGESLSCGCLRERQGPDNPLWKGGKTVNSDGYIRLRYRDSSGRIVSIFEHRKVMGDFLGRSLNDNEFVHHKNGVRNDNRLENLELWVSSQPSGQKPIDLVNWAKEILELYDNPKYLC